MLREATSAEFTQTRRLLRRRMRFSAGRTLCEAALSAREFGDLQERQLEHPVPVAEQGEAPLLVVPRPLLVEDDALGAQDVMALVSNGSGVHAGGSSAHALMAGEDVAVPTRSALTIEVKRAVWERCGGRCTECGTDQLLEFDHVIPLALGGSNGERNLQLLCAECNRAKSDSL